MSLSEIDIQVYNVGLRFIPVSFRFVPVLFRFISVSFRYHSVSFRYHSVSFRYHSVSFRFIPVPFRFVPVHSVPFLCLVMLGFTMSTISCVNPINRLIFLLSMTSCLSGRYRVNVLTQACTTVKSLRQARGVSLFPST